jgi:hypothetical protein
MSPVRRAPHSLSASELRLGDLGLKELDRVARWILDDHLLAADSVDDVAAKAGAVFTQPLYGRLGSSTSS